MTRPHDWPERLAAFIEMRRAMPFSWEQNNCGLFAADWIVAVLSVDIAAKYRGASMISLQRRVRAAGGVDEMFAKVAAKRGWEQVPSALASRGDVVSYLTAKGYALGVCIGARAALMDKKGLGFVNTAACARAWRI